MRAAGGKCVGGGWKIFAELGFIGGWGLLVVLERGARHGQIVRRSWMN